MKILHFIYDHINNPWVGGGGAVRAYEIYRRLSEKGHQITIVSGKYPAAADYSEGNMAFRFVGSSKSYMISTFSYAYEGFKLLKVIYKNYDVVIEDFAPWNPIFSCRFRKKKKIILQVQSYIGREILKKYFIPGIPFYLLERFYVGAFENVLSVSSYLLGRFKTDGYIVSNGIDERLLELENKSGNYAAFIGRLDLQTKGLDTFVKAFENSDIPALVAGDGRDRDVFLKRIRGKSNIKWMGLVKGIEKKDFLRNMRFLVLPSRFEGQGIAVLEAAACGKPVIVSDIPELRYAVDAGFGLAFSVAEAGDLAEKIQYLWRNEAAVREMGLKGRAYAKKYTWNKIAEDYESYLT